MTDVVRPPATTLNDAPESGRSGLSADGGDEEWRHRMMTIGHDPLKPVPS
jgi:hypothetical protein